MRETQEDKPRRAELLARLRNEVARLESCHAAPPPDGLHLTPLLDNCFDQGALPLGCLHEIVAAGRDEDAAANGFVAALLGKLPKNSGLVWITKRRTVFPPGLAMFGLEPDRIVFAELPKERDALWSAEEALRSKAVSAVVADIANIDLTASRRLQLAAEHSGAVAFLLRVNAKSLSSSACVSRWQVRHAASIPPDGLPGVGFPRWDVELVKVRNGRGGRFTLEWRGSSFIEIDTPVTVTTRAHRKAGAA
jgi:protein ImuA